MECKIQIPFSADEAQKLTAIFSQTKTIAIVGLSPDETKDSNKVAKYLLSCGFDIIPIYPKEEYILGKKVVRSLSDITVPVDIVDVFRKGDALPDIVTEALKLHPKLIWGQIGCESEEANHIAQSAHTWLVSGKCIMVEHRRLGGR